MECQAKALTLSKTLQGFKKAALRLSLHSPHSCFDFRTENFFNDRVCLVFGSLNLQSAGRIIQTTIFSVNIVLRFFLVGTNQDKPIDQIERKFEKIEIHY